MPRTYLLLAGIALLAVLYFVITKANTALSNGKNAFNQETVTPEQQAQDILDNANLNQ